MTLRVQPKSDSRRESDRSYFSNSTRWTIMSKKVNKGWQCLPASLFSPALGRETKAGRGEDLFPSEKLDFCPILLFYRLLFLLYGNKSISSCPFHCKWTIFWGRHLASTRGPRRRFSFLRQHQNIIDQDRYQCARAIVKQLIRRNCGVSGGLSH